MSFAVNFDTGVWFFTIDKVSTVDVWIINTFTSTDFTFVTVGVISARDWDTFEFFTSAAAILTFRSGVVLAHVVTNAVDLDTFVFGWRVVFGVTNVTTKGVAVLVGSAF